jgi:hypothetical protein
MQQIDFMQAHSQAPIKCDMCMELPAGIKKKHRNTNENVLKLLSNLKGQKQAGQVWNQYMVVNLQ